METTTLHVPTQAPPHLREARLVTNYVSWGAIFAGVFVAMTIATVLNLLGLGLDLITFNPDMEQMADMAIISIVWVVLTSIIAMLAGGWIAGRMSGPELLGEGALHGLVMCAVSVFITFILASLGTMIVGVMSTPVSQSLFFAQSASQGLGILVLVIFVTFLLSAIASAFGGLWGAYSDREIFVRRVVVKKV